MTKKVAIACQGGCATTAAKLLAIGSRTGRTRSAAIPETQLIEKYQQQFVHPSGDFDPLAISRNET